MFLITFYSNNKTWVDMTPEERKIFLIVLGIFILLGACYRIYYYLKNKKQGNINMLLIAVIKF